MWSRWRNQNSDDLDRWTSGRNAARIFTPKERFVEAVGWVMLGAYIGLGVMCYQASRRAEIRDEEQNKILAALYESMRTQNEAIRTMTDEFASIERIEVKNERRP